MKRSCPDLKILIVGFLSYSYNSRQIVSCDGKSMCLAAAAIVVVAGCQTLACVLEVKV